MEHYKAQLVDKGYNQEKGLDHEETFAPRVKMTFILTLIYVVLHR